MTRGMNEMFTIATTINNAFVVGVIVITVIVIATVVAIKKSKKTKED